MPSSESAFIPKSARAALITAPKQDLVVKLDYPVKQASELAPGECLVKLEYAGVCHSDLHVREGGWTGNLSLPEGGLVGGTGLQAHLSSSDPSLLSQVMKVLATS